MYEPSFQGMCWPYLYVSSNVLRSENKCDREIEWALVEQASALPKHCVTCSNCSRDKHGRWPRDVQDGWDGLYRAPMNSRLHEQHLKS